MNILIGFEPGSAGLCPEGHSHLWTPGELHQVWRNPLLPLSSTCSVLPIRSPWHHKKIFMNLGVFYSHLKICNVKCVHF